MDAISSNFARINLLAIPVRKLSRTAALLFATALALGLAGCGDEGPSTGLSTIDLSLAGGGFAKSTPRQTKVPADSLIILKVSADDAGPYSIGLLSAGTAQTFEIPENGTKSISIDALGPGGTAKLILNDGKSTVELVAPR